MKPPRYVAMFSIAGLCVAVSGCGPSNTRQSAAVKAEMAAEPDPGIMVEQTRPASISAEAPAPMAEPARPAMMMEAPAPKKKSVAPKAMMAPAPPPRPAFQNVRPDIRIGNPSGDVELPVAKSTTTALLTKGDRTFFVDFGPDPVIGGDSINAVASGGGTSWKLTRGTGGRNFGFSYLSGFWQQFETDRTRTITWGGINSGAGRVLPAGDGLPERDQIFIFCGGADVSPVDDPGGSKVKVTKGHYVTATTSGGKVVISAPQPFPTRGMRNPPADAESIIRFIEAMRAAHPDPCNP